jgi:hypothetical protein
MNRLDSFISQFPDITKKAAFEIWFAVVIDYNAHKAIWIRYTTLSQKTPQGMMGSAFMWASFYDALDSSNFCFAAKRYDFEKLELRNNDYNFPNGTVSPDKLNGKLNTIKGDLNWDLNFEHRYQPLKYVPGIIESLGIAKTKAVITSPFGKVNGEVSLDGKKFAFNNAGGVLTHLWGSSFIEELIWIYVPQFDNDMDGWSLEIVSVRPKSYMPPFTFFILLQRGKVNNNNIVEALAATVSINYPAAEFKIKINDTMVKIKCRLNLEQASRFVYQDPSGSSRYIVHSDVSEVICQLEQGTFKKILACKQMAAVEFHSVNPWDDEVFYDPLGL